MFLYPAARKNCSTTNFTLRRRRRRNLFFSSRRRHTRCLSDWSSDVWLFRSVQYRKRQGFNSVSMIAAFPTWASDQYASTYADKKGIFYRNAWEEFGLTLPDGKPTAKYMNDERGYRPFEILPTREGLPDFDSLVPQYFQSLDKKINYLNDHGFIAMVETTRRDNCPPWKAYFNFRSEEHTSELQ